MYVLSKGPHSDWQFGISEMLWESFCRCRVIGRNLVFSKQSTTAGETSQAPSDLVNKVITDMRLALRWAPVARRLLPLRTLLHNSTRPTALLPQKETKDGTIDRGTTQRRGQRPLRQERLCACTRKVQRGDRDRWPERRAVCQPICV